MFKILDIASRSKDQAYWVESLYIEFYQKAHQRRQVSESSRTMLQIEWFVNLYIRGKTELWEMGKVMRKGRREAVRPDFSGCAVQWKVLYCEVCLKELVVFTAISSGTLRKWPVTLQSCFLSAEIMLCWAYQCVIG